MPPSIAQTHPALAEQFHPDNERPIEKVTPGTRYKALWACGKPGHLWRASVFNRTSSQATGCPVCKGKLVVAGVNDLATTHPDIAARVASGSPFAPTEINAGSHKVVGWECPEGHRWNQRVDEAVRNNARCRQCTSLGHLYPEIAAELSDPSKAMTIAALSNIPVSWTCPQGHSWEAFPYNRIQHGTGCPYCTGKKPVPGHSDAAALYPHLVSETDFDLTSVRPGSAVVVEWNCSAGHSWKAQVSTRTSKGTGCPVCSGRVSDPGVNDLATLMPELAASWSEKNDRGPFSVLPGSSYLAVWVCPKHGDWTARVNKRALHGTGCPTCAWESFSSRGEKEMADFIAAHYTGTLHRNYRKIAGAGEVDMYLPDKGMAIEFNGIYWHSEAGGKSRMDHYTKRQKLADQGVRLLVVWEDDWRDRREIVESMLAAKIGMDRGPSIGARKCSLDTDVLPDQCHLFLNSNHLQGSSARATFRLGLRDPEGALVAVISATRVGTRVYLDRFATAVRVPGGFTRLLAELRRRARASGASEIVTFADYQVSDGGLYAASGFHRDKDLAPDYSYVVSGTREHKFGYRLARFRRDPNLIFREGLTERELAAINNLHRAWDYGKQRWVLPL